MFLTMEHSYSFLGVCWFFFYFIGNILDTRLGALLVLLREGGVTFWRLSFAEGLLIWYGFLYFDAVLWDFLFGRRARLVTPTTFSLIGASDIPAMFRAWQRYSPASLYDNPFRLIIDQRTPTRGDSCITET